MVSEKAGAFQTSISYHFFTSEEVLAPIKMMWLGFEEVCASG